MLKITKREIIMISLLLFSFCLFEAFRLSDKQYFNDSYKNEILEKQPGGKEIPTDYAYNLISAYRNLHTPEKDNTIYKTTGWHINKKAIENIFNKIDMKALSFDLVDEDGTLKLILQGSPVEMENIETGIGNSIFIVQSMCPSDCSSLEK